MDIRGQPKARRRRAIRSGSECVGGHHEDQKLGQPIARRRRAIRSGSECVGGHQDGQKLVACKIANSRASARRDPGRSETLNTTREGR